MEKFTDIPPFNPNTLLACDAFYEHLILQPFFSLCFTHKQTQMAVCVCLCVAAVSFHSALNEPIIGVYVALMRASIRRETLHRSPHNQWDLVCYTTSRFSPLTYPLSHRPFLLSRLHFLSSSLMFYLSVLFLLCSISKGQAWGIRSIGHEESFKRNKIRPLQLVSSFLYCIVFPRGCVFIMRNGVQGNY